MDFTSICSKVIFIISLFHVIMRGGVGVTPHRVEEDIFNIRKCWTILLDIPSRSGSTSRLTSTHCNKFELRTTLIRSSNVVGKWSQKMQRISSLVASQEGGKGFLVFNHADTLITLLRFLTYRAAAKPTKGASWWLLLLLTIWRR